MVFQARLIYYLFTQATWRIGSLACSLELGLETISDRLESLLAIPNPLTQALGLYILYQLDRERSRDRARQFLRAKLEP